MASLTPTPPPDSQPPPLNPGPALLLIAIGLLLGGLAARRLLRPSAPPVLPARPVETGFASYDAPASPRDPGLPLAPGQPYYFWLELGPAVASAAGPSTSMPTDEARLSVALFTFEGELRLEPDPAASGLRPDIGELQLLSDGTTGVVRQGARPAGLPPDSDLLSRRLFFGVRAPETEDDVRLRCNIYYQQVLVQSRLIQTRVMARPQPDRDAAGPTVDYTLSRTLSPAHLTRLAPHRLSLLLNRNGDGTHTFRFFGSRGEQLFKSDATFDGHELQELIRQARGALRLAAWGDDHPWSEDRHYRYVGPPDQERLTRDLARCAIRGYRIYDAIANRLAGGAAEAAALADLMRDTGLVQIAMKESPRHVLPAAMIYDYGFDTGAPAYSLCPAFVDGLHSTAPLETLSCFAEACPTRADEENESVICPSGFWGYRHRLGLPLSVAAAPDAPPELACQAGPRLTVGVSTDPAFSERQAHEQVLHGLRQDLGWSYATTRKEVFRLLKESRPHLVYFYCHGGVQDRIPFLKVGGQDDPAIVPENLRWQKIRWDDPRPLIFMNGCHTTALEPEVALQFVSAFVETAGASGVIGTEITVFEPLARAFAEACLRSFLGDTPIGESVRLARLALLKAGNPLGLAYIPFVIPSLHLAEQPATSQLQLAHA